MQKTSLKLSLLALASLSAAITLPANAPDGLAIGTQDANSTWTWEYKTEGANLHANLAPAGQDPLTIPFGSLLMSFGAGDGASCNGFFLDATDVQNAEAGLAGIFAPSPYSWSGKTITYTSGDAVAFGCNYGNGQQSSTDQFNDDMQGVNQKCGVTGAGWWGHPNWKSTYGRTQRGTSFC